MRACVQWCGGEDDMNLSRINKWTFYTDIDSEVTDLIDLYVTLPHSVYIYRDYSGPQRKYINISCLFLQLFC